jgi:hypothetical protein
VKPKLLLDAEGQLHAIEAVEAEILQPHRAGAFVAGQLPLEERGHEVVDECHCLGIDCCLVDLDGGGGMIITSRRSAEEAVADEGRFFTVVVGRRILVEPIFQKPIECFPGFERKPLSRHHLGMEVNPAAG